MDHINNGLGVARAAIDLSHDTGLGAAPPPQSAWTDDVTTIDGTSGNDSLVGGSGDDSITAGRGDDTLIGGDGDDSLIAGAGSDFMRGGNGDDLMNGGDGFDRVSFFGAPGGVHVDLNLQGQAQDTGQGMDTLLNIEDVSGTQFADTLVGDGADNFLWAQGAEPSGPADFANAGAGDDLVDVIGDGTTAVGGAGVDTLVIDDGGVGTMSAVHIDLSLQGEMQDTGNGMMLIKGFENAEGAYNEATADTIIGDGGDNVLAGAAGDDSLAGGDGGDRLLGDGEIATTGPDANGPVAETESGVGAGADTLDGGSGADTLVGGGGADVLTGGAGVDRFVYLDVSDSAPGASDLITDLGKADLIDLSAIDADTTTDGDQAFTQATKFTDQAGQLVVHYDKANDVTHILMDVDGDGLADADIEVAGNHRHFDNFVL